ncbi:BglG family transcription antiterminator LicT [Subdoligranulum variabile]|uniref:Transcription antiterminator LicT n=1 Tax=Subdoligranulum variabile DSM 15176 TaxID=411471 RepID=D1PSC1_9FIRM|nr:PRD domain-containing protein [Subdoligranulum variabile]EFB74406.1 transcription antiterminator LicT [Subdoligranulum variabile DSM 15176]UWP69461.1 PRD domain-containing protein [Subdoligranulum variabile]
MRIKKVINNNILCVIDEKGNEMIVAGKGLGFGRKVAQFVDPAQVEKVYRMEDKTGQRRLRELVEQIPIEHLDLTEAMIAEIKAAIHQPLNESLLITLADHISFAIQRKAQGIEFKNPLAGSILCYYPTEYQLGQRCLAMVKERFGVELSPDEAAFIALHIVNAELNTDMSEMYDITRLIEGVIQVVEYYYRDRGAFDRESLTFHRFVVHLRYFAQRLFQGKLMTDSADESEAAFRALIARNCKEHYKCAQCVADYIEKTWHQTLSQEELIYLTIHLKRVAGDLQEIDS